MQTSAGVEEQGLLAELLGDPQELSAEVSCRGGVLREEWSQAEQKRGISQTLEVLRILGQPRPEDGAHRSAQEQHAD